MSCAASLDLQARVQWGTCACTGDLCCFCRLFDSGDLLTLVLSCNTVLGLQDSPDYACFSLIIASFVFGVPIS